MEEQIDELKIKNKKIQNLLLSNTSKLDAAYLEMDGENNNIIELNNKEALGVSEVKIFNLIDGWIKKILDNKLSTLDDVIKLRNGTKPMSQNIQSTLMTQNKMYIEKTMNQ